MIIQDINEIHWLLYNCIDLGNELPENQKFAHKIVRDYDPFNFDIDSRLWLESSQKSTAEFPTDDT